MCKRSDHGRARHSYRRVMPVPKPNKLTIIFATMAAAFAISSGDATAQRNVTATFVARTLSRTIP
jgi:hypothetical protein